MKKYIIVGLTPQGLSVLRTLARAGGEVHAFCHSRKNVGYYSRYGQKTLFGNIGELRDNIKRIADEADEKPVCYITSGEMLAWILRDFTDLYEICDVYSGPLETIEILAHKDKMYEYAVKCGFDVAKYVTLDKLQDKSISFPAFIKRNFEIPLFFKAEKIESRDKLERYLAKIRPEQCKDVILQEFISCERPMEISCQALFVDGKCAGTLVAHQKIRLKGGLTAAIEEIEDIDLKRHINDLCENFFEAANTSNGKLSYSGLIEFEFIYDLSTQKLWFVEVNTRSCGLQSSFAAKYKNLSETLLHPDKFVKLQSATPHLRWMNIQRNIRAGLRSKNFSGLADIFTSSFDVFDTKDMKPFMMQFLPR